MLKLIASPDLVTRFDERLFGGHGTVNETSGVVEISPKPLGFRAEMIEFSARKRRAGSHDRKFERVRALRLSGLDCVPMQSYSVGAYNPKPFLER